MNKDIMYFSFLSLELRNSEVNAAAPLGQACMLPLFTPLNHHLSVDKNNLKLLKKQTNKKTKQLKSHSSATAILLFYVTPL